MAHGASQQSAHQLTVPDHPVHPRQPGSPIHGLPTGLGHPQIQLVQLLPRGGGQHIAGDPEVVSRRRERRQNRILPVGINGEEPDDVLLVCLVVVLIKTCFATGDGQQRRPREPRGPGQVQEQFRMDLYQAGGCLGSLQIPPRPIDGLGYT